MKTDKTTKLLLVIIAAGIWANVLVKTHAGASPAVAQTGPVEVTGSVAIEGGTVDVTGSVVVENTLDVTGSVDVENIVDVNFARVIGYPLARAERGMDVGVKASNGMVIPVNWGKVRTVN